MNKHVANFSIGFFASLCAVFVPRMLAMLNSNSGDIQFFHANYIAVGLVFSLVIGGVTVIFEYSKNKTVADTFMTALGIPALLAGALNTGTASVDLHNSESSNQKLVEVLKTQSGIRIEEGSAGITPLQAVQNSPQSRLDFSLIPSAHAQDNQADSGENQYNLGIQVEQKPYVVVLGKSNNQAEALQKAAMLRTIVPDATAVQSGKDFLVIDGTANRSRADAMLRAIELQNKTGLKPYLLQVK